MTTENATGMDDTLEAAKPPADDTGLDRVQELTAALQRAEDQAAQNRDAYLRTAAELDNVRKRSERDLENAHKYALERFLRDLLPVKDSLEAAVAAATGAHANLQEGLEMTLKLLETELQRFGVTEISPSQGDAFNPERHEAMTMQPSAEAAPGSVLLTVQKGYLLEDRLLRPARVIVAKAPDAAA